MTPGWRWVAASSLSVVVMGATWVAGQWILGLDVATAVTLATSAAAVTGTPAAAWAAHRAPAGPPSRAASGDGRSSPPFGRHKAWNVPPRSMTFTGRADLLHALHKRLGQRGRVVILALHGMGGVGKTCLATESPHH